VSDNGCRGLFLSFVERKKITERKWKKENEKRKRSEKIRMAELRIRMQMK
jgi:hypothetical protein